MQEIKQNPIEWFVSGFGVLTAAMFVASGAMNGLLFWANWRLNYFLIANPSDVIMSAFVWGTLLAVAATVSMVVVHVARAFNKPFDYLMQGVLEQLAAMNGISWPAGLKVESKKFRLLEWSILFVFYFILFLATVIIGSIKQGTPFWYDTGLKVAPAASFGDVPCGDGKVEWLGSASAVLKCGDQLVVIHKLDDLQTVPRRETAGSAEPRSQANAPAPRPAPPPAPAPTPKAAPQDRVVGLPRHSP